MSAIGNNALNNNVEQGSLIAPNELERQIAQQALDSTASDVSEYTRVLSELAADATAKVINGIDAIFGDPLIQHINKIDGDRVERGLPRFDTGDAPSRAAPPAIPVRTCTRAEANRVLRSARCKEAKRERGGAGGYSNISEELKKVGNDRSRSWIDWFLHKLTAVGLAVVSGFVAGTIAVVFGCPVSFAIITGLVVASGVGLGYSFFLAGSDDDTSTSLDKTTVTTP